MRVRTSIIAIFGLLASAFAAVGSTSPAAPRPTPASQAATGNHTPRGEKPAPATPTAATALQFDRTTCDLGAIREEDGPVTRTFAFRNTGTRPVAILSATATCGCTLPEYPRKPVLAGEEGVISITYDPTNRPGAFDRTVTVTLSDSGSPLRLRIAGTVIPRKKSDEELYPVYIGDGLHIEDNFHAFSYIEHGKRTSTAIGFINMSSRRLRLSVGSDHSQGILRLDCPSEVAAGERGEIVISYDVPDDCPFYGTLTDRILFTVNGRISDAEAVVTGIVTDNRDNIADNRAPKAELNKNIVNFGTVKHAEHSRSDYLELSNTGSGVLHVRAVECRDDAVEISLRAGDSLSPSLRRRIEVRVDPSRKDYGSSVERIRIVTDDADRPLRDIKVSMIVTD